MAKSVKRPLIVAHRGGSPADVENSLAAFEHALAVGADLIESDLRRSADGTIVLYHDAAVQGRKISTLTLAELRALIPTLMTLEELLDRLAGVGPSGRLVLDLKERGIEKALIPILEARPELVPNVLVSTVHTRSLRRLAKRFPGMRLALSRGHLISTLRQGWSQRAVAAVLRALFPIWLSPQVHWSRATAVALQHHLLDRVAVRRYRSLGRRVYSWTVDDCAEARRLADAGVDMIATNVPRELLRCFGRGAETG